MRILLVAIVALIPTLAFAGEPFVLTPTDRNDRNCKVLTENGVTGCHRPQVAPGSQADILLRSTKPLASMAADDFFIQGRAKAMEELRRRLHEERLERGYQAPPKVERRI